MSRVSAFTTPAAPPGFFPGAQPAGMPAGAPLRVLAFGDSYVWNAWLSPNRQFRSSSPLSYAAQRLPLWYQTGDLMGVVGETTGQILARIATPLARPLIDAAILFAGNNDFAQAMANTTVRDSIVATALANIRTIAAQFHNANIPLCICTVPTRAASTALQIQATQAYNAWLLTVLAPAMAPRVAVADIAAALVNPATGLPIAGLMQADGIHPSHNGARLAGEVLAGTLARWCTNRDDTAWANVDPNNALAGFNPFFLTFGAASGNGITGQIPAGWFTWSDVGPFTSGTIVGASVPRADGRGNWAQLTFTNAVQAANTSVGVGINSGNFARPAILPVSGFAYLVFEAEVDSGFQGLQGFTANLSETTGAVASITTFGSDGAGTELAPAGTTRFRVQTPALPITAGSTNIACILMAQVRSNIPGGVNGTIRLGVPAIRVVPASRSNT